MISYEQFVSDVGDFLESKNLTQEFIDLFVANADRKDYQDLIENR